MSSYCGSVCLLVLLGAVLAFGSPVHFISENLRRTHGSIADVLKLTKPAIGRDPLFSSVIRSINTSCQRKEELQLMNVTLDIYTRIFSSILQHNQHHDNALTPALLANLPAAEMAHVESNLSKLKQEMETLKSKLGHLKHDKEDVLSKLSKIDVDDPEVQKKALAQYKEIYQAASVIATRRCGPTHSSSAE
uniref:Interferon gamma 1-like protein n=1 Tax=Siniperca chuatsi TaxID=119488 RepID=A0A516AFH1_SINCH|nr:interferon gamma 1-like protein [Siniperca chuatsi]